MSASQCVTATKVFINHLAVLLINFYCDLNNKTHTFVIVKLLLHMYFYSSLFPFDFYEMPLHRSSVSFVVHSRIILSAFVQSSVKVLILTHLSDVSYRSQHLPAITYMVATRSRFSLYDSKKKKNMCSHLTSFHHIDKHWTISLNSSLIYLELTIYFLTLHNLYCT